jgi:hypothetical protein
MKKVGRGKPAYLEADQFSPHTAIGHWAKANVCDRYHILNFKLDEAEGILL